jgi:NADH-quinone oxidoreductase subunit A
MLQDYLPILLQAIVAIGFAAIGLVLSVIVGRVGKRNPVKDSPYECGMLPIGEAQPRFSVKFYMVAMLFILFDIEIVFMYPWAVVYRDYISQFNPWTIFGSMLGFVTILMIGFVYAIKKGALDWKR